MMIKLPLERNDQRAGSGAAGKRCLHKVNARQFVTQTPTRCTNPQEDRDKEERDSRKGKIQICEAQS